MCLSAATAILPITAGGAVAGMGTTAGVLYALEVSKGVAVNFALASGLLLTGAALVAAAFGLAGSLLLTFRARSTFRRQAGAQHQSATPALPRALLEATRGGTLARLGLLPDPPALAEGLSPVQGTRLELPQSKRRR
jgi:hypothetical protein